MEKKLFIYVEATGLVTLQNRDLHEVVEIAKSKNCNYVLEEIVTDCSVKSNLYVWDASFKSKKELKEIFKNDEVIMEELKKCNDKEQSFIYIPNNLTIFGPDKRDYISIERFSAVHIIKPDKKISGGVYAYGSHGCLGGFIDGLQNAIDEAKKEGFGFVVRYKRLRGKEKRTILAWNAEVLTCNQALQKFKNDKVMTDYITQHYKSGYKIFVASYAPEKDLFPFDFFDAYQKIKA